VARRPPRRAPREGGGRAPSRPARRRGRRSGTPSATVAVRGEQVLGRVSWARSDSHRSSHTAARRTRTGPPAAVRGSSLPPQARRRTGAREELLHGGPLVRKESPELDHLGAEPSLRRRPFPEIPILQAGEERSARRRRAGRRGRSPRPPRRRDHVPSRLPDRRKRQKRTAPPRPRSPGTANRNSPGRSRRPEETGRRIRDILRATDPAGDPAGRCPAGGGCPQCRERIPRVRDASPSASPMAWRTSSFRYLGYRKRPPSRRVDVDVDLPGLQVTNR